MERKAQLEKLIKSQLNNDYTPTDSLRKILIKFFDKILESVKNNLSIEREWRSFNSFIKEKKDQDDFTVDERTQCSIDLLKELTKVTLKVKSDQIATGGTPLKTQKDTNLCPYFATMSALRHQLKKTVGSEKSGKDTSKVEEEDQEKYANLNFEEYIKLRDKDEKRYERDLFVMIGNVSPRTLSVRFINRHNLFLNLISKHRFKTSFSIRRDQLHYIVNT